MESGEGEGRRGSEGKGRRKGDGITREEERG